MQSVTTTNFRQKTCPRCKNNHNEDGVLCAFCVEAENLKRLRAHTTPTNCWIQCLIEREGDTTLSLGTMHYTFSRNEHGHSVCEIVNTGHYNQIIKSGYYVPYDKPETEVVTNDCNGDVSDPGSAATRLLELSGEDAGNDGDQRERQADSGADDAGQLGFGESRLHGRRKRR